MMLATTTPSFRSKRKSSAAARRVLISLEQHVERGDAAERSVERILLEHFWRPRRLAE
jgi:hypothetical protein